MQASIDPDIAEAERILHDKGLIDRDERDHSWQTTRRWQGVLARSSIRLLATGDEGTDLRIPIIVALVDIFGDTHDADSLASCVHVMLDIERRDLSRLWRVRTPPPAPL